MIKTIFSYAVIILAMLVSCSKNDNEADTSKGKMAKFTITVVGASEADADMAIALYGADINDAITTRWKVNGVTLNNQTGVHLNSSDFTGNTTTYVVESLMPLIGIDAVINCKKPLDGSTTTYAVSFKAEIDGKVVTNDENIIVSQEHSYATEYSYN